MMGKLQTADPKLFYWGFNLAERISSRNPLRAVAGCIDFGWIRREVDELYGYNGNESVDPVVILKLHFLMFFENVPSARLLMERLGERLDWLWFCGYDLDSELPDHSVLSKARRRWGRETFVEFFRRVLEQCVAEGLVDSRVLHVDGSLISANASMDSLGPRLRLAGGELFDRLEQEELSATPVSSTDPDARLRRKNGRLQLGYQEVRAVDDQCGIITAGVTTSANADESAQLLPLVAQHEENIGSSAQTVVADKKFGTGENYQQLQNKEVHPCIAHSVRTPRKGRIGQSAFTYLPQEDCYVCPRGQRLPYSCHIASKRAYLYKAPAKVCAGCDLRSRCATQRGRIIWRHEHQEAIEWADGLWSRQHRRRLMRRRLHVMEGSFADASNQHGYKRARWRGITGITVQNLLIAAIQNVRKLLRYARHPRRSQVQGVLALNSRALAPFLSLLPRQTRFYSVRERLQTLLTLLLGPCNYIRT